MTALFRKVVATIYWVALPVSLLICAGWLIGAVMSPSNVRSWLMAAGTGGFAGLIGWRLWLNSRALGWAAAPPGRRRLFLVVLPLLAIAFAGVAAAATGVAWLASGIWLIAGPEPAASGYRDPVSEPAVPLVGGCVLILIGGTLCIPLIRSLRRREGAVDHF